MKTQQILKRPFLGQIIRQQHDTQMLCATDLINLYKAQNPGEQLHVGHYMANAATQRYIEYLEQVEGLLPQQVVNSTKGRNGATWMHPFLFVDFAMWVSPEFKHAAIKWISDNLCSFRDMAGDTFKELNAEIEKLGGERPWCYTNEARLLQGLAGIPTGKRNEASEDQLKKLAALQNADIKLIKSGMTDFYKRKAKLLELREFL